MAEETKFLGAGGFIQKFGDKDAITTRDVNGQTVRDFTIKVFGSQKLVRITVWPEFKDVEITPGSVVFVDGKFRQSEGQNGRVFYSIDAKDLVVIPGSPRADREVVNQPTTTSNDQSASAQDDDIPF